MLLNESKRGIDIPVRIPCSMARYYSSLDSSSCGSFLPVVPGRDESSRAPLLEALDNSTTSEVQFSFDASLLPHSTPVLPPAFPIASPPAVSSPILPARDLFFHLSISPPPPAPPQRNVEAELREIVDDLLRHKESTQCTLAEENASLRAQVA